MDHATVKDAAAKAGEAAASSAEQVQSDLQDKVAQGKAVWRDAKASAGDAIDKATALARDASAAAAQAGEVAQDVARQVGNQVSQATTALYQQGSAAGNYLTRYTAEQPWTALLAAAAIGYGLAYLVHRPRT
ncbi:MAG: hypothetical protein ACJ8AH_28060 [Stellaceae bacterium]|jgi:ElaB/YqjD/DUF883 family membrane-anchored ribosome-binding protein